MRDLIIRSINRRRQTGIAAIGAITVHCALGKAGMAYRKREGDNATPIGRWPVAAILYRRDRPRHHRALAARGLFQRARPFSRSAGWCDAEGDRNYNRFVRHPYPASAEHLWRDDHLYDIIVILGHNARPRIQGHGSAIFIHLGRPAHQALPGSTLAPTAGCAAFTRRDLCLILSRLRPGSAVRIVG